MTSSDHDLAITVIPSPEGNLVDYFHEIDIPVLIKNLSASSVHIDSISLHFQSDWDNCASQCVVNSVCSDLDIETGGEDYSRVRVMPRPLFLASTNCFQVVVKYRRSDSLGTQRQSVKRDASYIIVRLPPAIYGQLFVSYKDPEDLALATLLGTIARRLGFTAYIAPADPQPGSIIWEEKIPPAIATSRAILVIWTENTPLGKGVQREISIARNVPIKEIPFIERRAIVPAEYRSMKSEITFFERRTAAQSFASALDAYRRKHSGL